MSASDDAEAVADSAIPIPAYLSETYWWAYVHPSAVHVFERRWLVNLILWGNYRRLCAAALDALGGPLDGRTLQVACVYGDLTLRIAARVAPGAALHVVDVLPIQVDNLRRKLDPTAPVELHCGDATRLDFAEASFDRALLFFLLHELPEQARRAALREAVRVVRPGGRIVIVDYHRPGVLHPLFLPMAGVLAAFEPFALDLWAHPVVEYLPASTPVRDVQVRTAFGGLYQVVTITR